MLIINEIIIIIIAPVITGNKIYSIETSANNAIKGLAAAGGWITLKYIINVTVVPTERPNVINEIPTNSLNSIPTTIPNIWPKNTFPGWANSLSWKINTIKVVEPKEEK